MTADFNGEQPKPKPKSQPKPAKTETSCSEKYCGCLKRKPDTRQRVINVGKGTVEPPNRVHNAIKNQKYSIITFIPVVFYNQFKFFFNLFFLVTALSQLYPPLVVGNISFLLIIVMRIRYYYRILVHLFRSIGNDADAYDAQRGI